MTYSVNQETPSPKREAQPQIQPLGVGIVYNPSLPEFIKSHLDILDYVSLIPDMGQTDAGVGSSPRFSELSSWTKFLDWLAPRKPLLAHNIAMSIGSANLFDEDYLAQIKRWHERYQFRWHSDHLSFVQVRGVTAHDESAGLALPVPYDQEVLDMICERIAVVQQIVPLHFIIENNVSYIAIPDQDMSEPEFLNQLAIRTGCGLLLDLHNIYVNARNHNFDAPSFVNQVDLSYVTEIHIAGGSELAGMYTDSHAGASPEPVWELLEYVIPNAPNLCAVTFELHESYFDVIGTNGIEKEIERARDIWLHYR